MYQIREHEEEVNNSFENMRKTIKKPKSLDNCGEEEEMERAAFVKDMIKDKNMVGDT